MKSLDEMTKYVEHDWAKINPLRAAWIEKFNKEMAKWFLLLPFADPAKGRCPRSGRRGHERHFGAHDPSVAV
jgi:hypothetical protein